MKPQHIDPEVLSPSREELVHCLIADVDWFLIKKQEAVQIHQDIRAHTTIGMHWGTFVLTDEHVLEPRTRIADLVRTREMRSDEFITVHHGETKVRGVLSPQSEAVDMDN